VGTRRAESLFILPLNPVPFFRFHPAIGTPEQIVSSMHAEVVRMRGFNRKCPNGG
jgi:hypothetical protein